MNHSGTYIIAFIKFMDGRLPAHRNSIALLVMSALGLSKCIHTMITLFYGVVFAAFCFIL